MSRRRPAARAASSPGGDRSEAFRILRSNLIVALAEVEHPTVLITSALPDEGKTSVCANLALSLAEAGLRVVAADVDLRHPDVHGWLGVHNEVGVSDVLLERCDLEQALQFVAVGRSGRGLYVLPTGPPVNDPTELLGTPRLAGVLGALSQQADILLLDSPPVIPVADTLVIGRLATGAVLVVESRKTPAHAVEQAKSALIRNQTRLLGVVLNKAQDRDLSDGYGYGYQSEDEAPEPG